MNISVVFQLSYLVCLLATCGYAAWSGGRAERQGAAIMLAGSLLSVPAMSFDSVEGWSAFKPGLAAVDVGVLVAFLAVALRSDRFWPLWATSCQLIAVAMHVAVLADPAAAGWAYSMAQPFWAYPMLVAVAIGTTKWRANPANPRARRLSTS